MDLNLLLNEAIGGRSGRRGGMLERLMRSFLWSAVNQAMSTALETATAPVKARTESRAAAAMEQAVPEPVTEPKPVAEPAAPVVTAATQALTAAMKPVGDFTTAKGSRYLVYEDGTTVRDKAARDLPGHEGDSGVKSQSQRTVYVADENASALSSAGMKNLEDQRLIIQDGLASLVTKLKGGDWGISPSSKDIPVFDKPQVGYHPLELWQREDLKGREGYKSQHAGNKITSMSGGAAMYVKGPSAETTQPQPQPHVAEQAMEEATRATERNAEAAESLVEPVDNLRRAFIGFLGYNADNVLPNSAGGGMRGGGNNNQPPAGPPADNNQGGGNHGGDNRPFRRPSIFQRIMRRGPRRAITRAGAMLGGGVARLAGGNAMAGAAAGARLGAGFAAASGGPAGVALIGLGLITKKVIDVFKQLAAASWETTMRIGQWSGQLTGAKAMLDVNRTLRDIRMAQDLAGGGAAYIKEQDRFEQNIMPMQTMMAQLGNWAGTTGLGMLNAVFENVINPGIEVVKDIGDTVDDLTDTVTELASNVIMVTDFLQQLLGLTQKVAKRLGDDADLLAAKEAEERLQKLKEAQAAIGPQMNNINAMMNDLAAGRRPF